MNWGYKLMTDFVLFVLGILVMVYKASQFSSELVTTGYYEKELVYQNQIDAMNRSAALNEAVTVSYNGKYLIVKFPDMFRGVEIVADVELYCPSDKRQDRHFSQKTQFAGLELVVTDLQPAKYYVNVNWYQNDDHYFDKIELIWP